MRRAISATYAICQAAFILRNVSGLAISLTYVHRSYVGFLDALRQLKFFAF